MSKAQSSEIKIFKLSEFNADKISFGELNISRNDRRSVVIYHDKQKCNVQFPRMSIPFGVKSIKYGDTTRYHLDLSFYDGHPELQKDVNSKRIKVLMHTLELIDHMIVKQAVECSKEWFGETKTIEQVSEMYKSILHQSNPDYLPTIKVKLPVNRDNEFSTEFYNDKDIPEEIKIESVDELENALQKGYHVKTIVKCQGLWFRKDEFGVSWEVLQVKIYPVKKETSLVNKLASYAFTDDSDDENDSDTSSSTPEP